MHYLTSIKQVNIDRVHMLYCIVLYKNIFVTLATRWLNGLAAWQPSCLTYNDNKMGFRCIFAKLNKTEVFDMSKTRFMLFV